MWMETRIALKKKYCWGSIRIREKITWRDSKEKEGPKTRLMKETTYVAVGRAIYPMPPCTLMPKQNIMVSSPREPTTSKRNSRIPRVSTLGRWIVRTVIC